MRNKIHQSGSGQLVIIILLTIALVGTLGVLYYQNFYNKSTKTTTTVVSNNTTTANTTTVVSNNKTFSNGAVTFSYPNSWVAADAEEMGNVMAGVKTADFASGPMGAAAGEFNISWMDGTYYRYQYLHEWSNIKRSGDKAIYYYC